MNKVTSIGEAAARVVKRIGDRALESLGVDVAKMERESWYRELGHAAGLARTCGVDIKLIRQGFVVRKGTKVEVVTFDDAVRGVLIRAIDRVDPE